MPISDIDLSYREVIGLWQDNIGPFPSRHCERSEAIHSPVRSAPACSATPATTDGRGNIIGARIANGPRPAALSTVNAPTNHPCRMGLS